MLGPDPLNGQMFDGRYRIIRKLGTGGMANVYLAEDEELGRRVAIKVLDERHTQDDQFVERFRREAKNAAGLSHPNIVSIYDRGQSNGTYYIAMEYLEGKTLKELLVARGPTPIRVAVDYTRQILGALAFAHRHGIVHRDIKPHNVIVAPDGRLKVTDFGIARSGSSQMTEAGSIIGTAQYLSPEQARGAPVDPSSDLYSVGIVLYEMLTGTVPFTGDTPLEIAMKHLSTVPEPPSEKRPEVPHDLDSIVLRALAKRPEERYLEAEEMDADLARVAKGLSVSPETEEAATAILAGAGVIDTSAATQIARRPDAPSGAYGPPRRTSYYEYDEPMRRRPLWPWALALLLVVSAGFAGYYVYTKIQDQLAGVKPISVPFVRGSLEVKAVAKIQAAGLVPRPHRRPSDTVPVGIVFAQNPDAGSRVARDSQVVILVSTGKPKVSVPDVRGQPVDDAVSALAEKGLKANRVYIHSSEPEGTVTAQDPPPGAVVVKGTKVRINVSEGPAPIPVPPVVGQPLDQAISTLQGAGFKVATPVYQDSSQPKDTVIGQDPGGNTSAPRGATVTLTVSRGPKTTTVPDVTGFDVDTAKAELTGAGFKVKVITIETSDPNLDNQVITQSPDGGTEATPKSTVTITVGKYVAPPTTTTTPTTDTTPFP
jgi:beta-lactam-binding protein with PASTA domain/predicted Ser/Thr protein kinase